MTEWVMLFVILVGAAPVAANGLIAWVDHIPLILIRAGRILGAGGPVSWCHVVIGAALTA